VAPQISRKKQLLERAADVFGSGTAPEPVDLAPLHAKIGQLALENDFLESRANQVWALDTTYIRMARGYAS